MLIKKLFVSDLSVLTSRTKFDVDKKTGTVDLGLLPVGLKHRQTADEVYVDVVFKKAKLNVDDLSLTWSDETETVYPDVVRQSAKEHEHKCENCKFDYILFKDEYPDGCQKRKEYLKLREEKEKELTESGKKIEVLDDVKIRIESLKKVNNGDGCKTYQNRYLETPFEADNIVDGRMLCTYETALVKIRPCKYKNKKTYLGILLDDSFPYEVTASYNSTTKELSSTFIYNPAIYISKTNEIIFGAESWWGRIESKEDLKDISDEEINNLWYVKALTKGSGD